MRFDYVKYDEQSVSTQEKAKGLCKEIECLIESMGPGRPQSLALTSLEEVYMWIGKAVRDNQVKRTGVLNDIPERVNS